MSQSGRRSIVFMENLPPDFPPALPPIKRALSPADVITNEDIANRRRRNFPGPSECGITNEEIARRKRRNVGDKGHDRAITNEDLAQRVRRHRGDEPRELDREAGITNEDIANRRRYGPRRGESSRPRASNTRKSERKELYDAINQFAHREIAHMTRDPAARMIWTLAADGAQRIAHKHGVRLRGWPPHVVFQTPSKFGSTDDLRQILTRLEHGRIWFERLSDAEREQLRQERVPEGETRGRPRVNGPPPKTSELVPEDSDLEED